MPSITAYDLLRAAKDSFSSDTRPSEDTFRDSSERSHNHNNNNNNNNSSMDSDSLPPLSPSTSHFKRPRRFGLRRLDRLCCNIFLYFPLLLVYSGTTWAVYTEAWSIAFGQIGGFTGNVLGLMGVFLYVMANWAYTYAVFTPPGSPSDAKSGYSHLPTSEPSTAPVTVKSSGEARFCKKCQFKKPDRTHHCSTCKTCILKMDHHCPWLATCLGLHNYKAFLQFLIYTSLLCLLSFAVSTTYVYNTIFIEYADATEFDAPINWTLMAVMSGIIGLVLSGFTIWHLMLVRKNMTTIESLEKIRYSSPLSFRNPAPPSATFINNNTTGLTQEQSQYYSYLSDTVSSKPLPHAFDLGPRANFRAVFGPSSSWPRWFIPLASTPGDGFTWETSSAWRASALALQHEREALARSAWLNVANNPPIPPQHRPIGHFTPHSEFGGNPAGLLHTAGMPPITRHPALSGGKKVARVESTGIIKTSPATPFVNRSLSKAERVLGYTDGETVPMRDLGRKRKVRERDADLFVDTDEEETAVEEEGGEGWEGW